jgi:hypothetical protein
MNFVILKSRLVGQIDRIVIWNLEIFLKVWKTLISLDFLMSLKNEFKIHENFNGDYKDFS